METSPQTSQSSRRSRTIRCCASWAATPSCSPIVYLVVGIAVEARRGACTPRPWSSSGSPCPWTRAGAGAGGGGGDGAAARTDYLQRPDPRYRVRLIFAGTTIVIIFVLAFLVGGARWAACASWSTGRTKKAPARRA